jgi:hypothetical protein
MVGDISHLLTLILRTIEHSPSTSPVPRSLELVNMFWNDGFGPLCPL